MKTAALLAALVVPAVSHAQLQRAPELQLPTAAELRETLSNSAPAAAPGRSVAARRGGACATLELKGVRMGRGAFENDFSLSKGGRDFAEIDVEDDSYSATLNQGGTIFTASIAKKANGRTATVKDCNGAVIGFVHETEDGRGKDGASSFSLRDAGNGFLAMTGWVEGQEFRFYGENNALVGVVDEHSFWSDEFSVELSGALDNRLVAVAVLMNNAAYYKRVAERNRENRIDRPGPGNRFDREHLLRM